MFGAPAGGITMTTVHNVLLRMAGFGAMLLAVPATNAAGPFGSIHIGNWSGGAYTDDKTGAFSHCVAGTSYASGIYVVVTQTVDGKWLLGFANSSWQMNRGETFTFDSYLSDHRLKDSEIVD
jgi:hypothetical protein